MRHILMYVYILTHYITHMLVLVFNCLSHLLIIRHLMKKSIKAVEKCSHILIMYVTQYQISFTKKKGLESFRTGQMFPRQLDFNFTRFHMSQPKRQVLEDLVVFPYYTAFFSQRVCPGRLYSLEKSSIWMPLQTRHLHCLQKRFQVKFYISHRVIHREQITVVHRLHPPTILITG